MLMGLTGQIPPPWEEKGRYYCRMVNELSRMCFFLKVFDGPGGSFFRWTL